MKIILNDSIMVARAVDIAEDGHTITTFFDVFEDDTIEELISRATDKLSDVYLDMCTPLM